jgi:hypothetical protein
MKKAFEENDTAPGASTSSPTKNAPGKVKTRRTKASKLTSSEEDGEELKTTPAPKRKRATPNKKTAVDAGAAKFKPDPDAGDEDELLDKKPKRAKITKAKVTLKPKTKAKGVVKKEEVEEEEEEEEEDAFYDAQEEVQIDGQGQTDDMFDIKTEAKHERKFTPPDRSALTSKFLQHRAEHC